jgi:uncharacterized protein YcbX
MLIEIGHVEAIFRYPVKSMSGERLEIANLGWHGLDGDRRLAFRRVDDRSGQASYPTCSCLLRAAVKTVLREVVSVSQVENPRSRHQKPSPYYTSRYHQLLINWSQ